MGLTPLVTGSGEPVTVVAHGLGATLADTRPLVSGVPGTRVLYPARGHGREAGRVTYDALADDLIEVADDHGATRALGVSLGAATILAALARRPDRFTHAVLFLPAVLDRPRTDPAVRRLDALAGALEAGDAAGVLAAVEAELPDDLGPAAAPYARGRAEFLLGSPGVARVIRDLTDQVPLADRSALATVTAEVLVLGQEGDPLHPAQLARELAAALPRARLTVFDRPGVLFRERARLRALVTGFLNAP